MQNAIKYFLKYSISADVLLFTIAILGVMSMLNISRSQFPRSESRNILVETVYIGASAKEVEEGVTIKIETELEGIENVKKISSTTVENKSTIDVEILSTANVDKVMTDVKNAVDRISSFPDDAETPVIYKRERLDLAADFLLYGDIPLTELKELAELAEQEILNLPEISKVTVEGYPDQEIEIAVRESAMNTYQLSFLDVAQAISKANLEVTAGKLEIEQTDITIRAKNKSYYALDLADIIVKTSPGGTNITLGMVADLNDIWADVPARNYYQGQPAVKFTVNSRLSEDIIDAAEATKRYIAQYNERGSEVKAALLTDGSLGIRQRTDLLLKNGIMGIGLVLLILGLFLRPRLAFWVALSIPISIAGMFIIAPFFGININMLSLFGLILVIGILVDDGVVITENIYQKFEEGLPPLEAAIKGVMEVVPSVISAVLTTCWFFMLFFLIEGTMGDFMSNVAFVVIATLGFSLIEGFFILPAHIAHSKDLNKDNKPNVVNVGFSKLMDFLRDKLYAPVLRFSMNNKMLAFSGGLVTLILSISLVAGEYVAVTFFPYIDVDEVVVSLRLPAGSTEVSTKRILDLIEEKAIEVNKEFKAQRPDNQDVMTCLSMSVGPTANEGSIKIVLLDSEARGIPGFEVGNAIKEKVGEVPEAENLTFGKASIFGAAINVGFIGTDMDKLRAAKNDLRRVLLANKALKDVADNDKKGGKELEISLSPKAKALGVDLQTIINQVRQGYFGYEVQRLQRGKDEVKVWVRYGESERSSLASLENMKIRVNTKTYPLKELAQIDMIDGVLTITHVNGRTKIDVTAEQLDPDASTTAIFNKLKDNEIPKILAKYPGVDVIYEGQSERAGDTIGSIKRWMPVILLLVFITIVLTFRSFKQAWIVLLLIPFAFIGVVGGHALHGKAISILSMFGILAVAGVVINDSLVLVSTMNRYLKEGMPFRDAVFQASVSRFRPIVLTSVTTIAGLMPLALETSMQAQFLVPMALSLAYGLAASTLAMLILLPILLVATNDATRLAWWIWEGETLTPEKAEPAVQELENVFE